MYQYSTTVLQQLLQLLPHDQFSLLTGQHQADRGIRTFSCWNQLCVMLYAQATGKESLRDIQIGLQTQGGKWYHLGIQSVAKSTVADASHRRSYKIFEGLFYAFLKKCEIFLPERKFEFRNDLYSLDGSVINLCLKLFNWAKFRKRKGAIRLHTLLNNKKHIPTFLTITDGKKHEIKEVRANWKKWELPKESLLTFDRGYIDYEWFYELHQANIFFVTRTKSNMQYVPTETREIHEENVLKDEVIEFVLEDAIESYPEALRLVTYWNEEKKKELKFLTNNFELSAQTIADIYKERWQIEIFFKWIKQHLKIKTFFGTSQNAVLSQVWIAMIYFLMLAYIRAQTKTGLSMLELSRVFAGTLLDRVSLLDLLSLQPTSMAPILKKLSSPQLELLKI